MSIPLARTNLLVMVISFVESTSGSSRSIEALGGARSRSRARFIGARGRFTHAFGSSVAHVATEQHEADLARRSVPEPGGVRGEPRRISEGPEDDVPDHEVPVVVGVHA